MRAIVQEKNRMGIQKPIEEGVRIQESGVRREIEWGFKPPIYFWQLARSWGIEPDWARRDEGEKIV